MMQMKAWCWTLMLMVVSATVRFILTGGESLESALAGQAEPDAITNSIGMKFVRIPAGESLWERKD